MSSKLVLASFVCMAFELRKIVYSQLDILSQIMYLTTTSKVIGGSQCTALTEARHKKNVHVWLSQALAPLANAYLRYPGLSFRVAGTVRLAPPHMDRYTFTDQVLRYVEIQDQATQNWKPGSF